MPTLQERADAIREAVASRYGSGATNLLDEIQAFAFGELQGAYDGGQADVIPQVPGPAPYAMVIAHPYGNMAVPDEEVSPDFEATIVASPKDSEGRIQLFDSGTGEAVSAEQRFTCVDGMARANFVTIGGQPIPPGSYKLQATFLDFQYGHYITVLVAGGGDPVPDQPPASP